MASPSDLLAKSFVGALDSLQNDIKVLKDVKNIRCLLDDKNKPMESKLQEVDCMVSQLEQTFALIEEDLDGQENVLQGFKLLLSNIEKQKEEISQVKQDIPSYLVTTTTVKSSKKNKNINTPVALAIDKKELEKVPSVTRGRLNIVQINESLVILKQLVIEKEKNLSSIKKTVQTKAFLDEYNKLKVTEHGNHIYMTEQEVRSTKVFENGEVTGKNILNTLRNLERLKIIRSNGQNTYILM